MKRLYSILMIFATLIACIACEVMGDGLEDVEIGSGEAVNISTAISPSCVVENREISRAGKQGYATRSLIDQITTKKMNANFIQDMVNQLLLLTKRNIIRIFSINKITNLCKIT